MNNNKNKINSRKSNDFELAYGIHEQLNCTGVTENAIIPKNRDKENYRPRTLIDQTLEYIDPTPNIYTLFVQFNARFFWNALLPVEVKWSNRMTSCAGICSFHPRNRQCVIALSAPLLKLRPRKDLVETLLHEMIHGYLFLTNNDRDRDGHGPEFCKHMNRINKEAGTTITIYHNFHDEVKLYQQHWWKCNGPCQRKPPYFGTVRRAMNRAPGPSDYWWAEHQRSCGGEFIKVKEPENYKSKKKNGQKTIAPPKPRSNIFDWLSQNGKPKPSPILKPTSSKSRNSVSVSATSTPCNGDKSSQNTANNIKKLGNNANNLHGWGTGGPSSSSNSSCSTPSKTCNSPVTSASSRKFSSSGVLGGSGRGYSKLLDAFSTPKNITKQSRVTFGGVTTSNTVVQTPKKGILKRTSSTSNIISNSKIQNGSIKCIVCKAMIPIEKANDHVNTCLDSTNSNGPETKKQLLMNDYHSPRMSSPVVKKPQNAEQPPLNVQEKSVVDSEIVKCPVCSKNIKTVDINDHLDYTCLPRDDGEQRSNSTSLNPPAVNTHDVIVINDSLSDASTSSDVVINEGRNTPSPVSPLIIKESHKCLVCDTVLQPGTSLNEHLEECVGSVFNDESTVFEDDDDVEISENPLQNDKYPCPACFEMIQKELMNQHLDTCLQNS